MSELSPYRVHLPVDGRPVTVFGAGGEALGHIAALRAAGAEVAVVAPLACTSVVDLAERGQITWRQRSYEPADLETPWLVVAATGEVEADRQIAKHAEESRTWCLRGVQPTPVDAVEEIGGRPGDAEQRIGEVVLVGGGPGDAGLLTVAGQQALHTADVIIVDRLAPLAALANLRTGVEVVDVGKVPRGAGTTQEAIHRLLIKHARDGRQVVRLKGGDNFLFGRGGEEVQACNAAGVPVRVVPGVSSALAVPAAVGIPVTHRGLNQGSTVVSGHVPPDDPRCRVDYNALASSGTDLVLMMAVANLAKITEALMAAGMPPETPAATITDGTLPSQRVVRGRVGTIADAVADAGLQPPAVTVIGAVVGFGTSPAGSDGRGGQP